jgi:periplasmic divalent cation tolerance protein
MSVGVMLSTAGSLREANRLAKTLVKQGLAACITVLPGAVSHFFWAGKLCREREVLILAKTTKGKAGELKNKIKEIHRYEVPEILFFQAAQGEKTYLEWVKKSLKKK